MKPGRKVVAGAAVVTFLVGVVTLFPARVVHRWFEPAGVVLSGVDGTVWSGTAQEMSAGGLYLYDVSWRLRPLRLFTGKLALQVEGRSAAGVVDTGILIGFGRVVTLDDLRADVRLQALQGIVDMPGLGGDARAEFDRLALRDGLPVAADGTVTITNLVAPMIYRGNIGDYEARFATTPEGIVASIEDVAAVVDLAAALSVYPDRRFEFLGKVGPTDRTPAEMRERMQFLGIADSQGRYELRTEGRF